MAGSLSETHPPLAPGLMLHALARNWWLLLLRGICAIVFGVLAFVWPGLTLLTLVLLYGAFALADGVFLSLRRSPAAPRRHPAGGSRSSGCSALPPAW